MDSGVVYHTYSCYARGLDAFQVTHQLLDLAPALPGIDDFAFTGPGNDASILAAINRFSTVVLIRPDGSQQTVLTAAAGLSNPSAVAVRGSTVYVLSSAYVTRTDPNILLARLHR